MTINTEDFLMLAKSVSPLEDREQATESQYHSKNQRFRKNCCKSWFSENLDHIFLGHVFMMAINRSTYISGLKLTKN